MGGPEDLLELLPNHVRSGHHGGHFLLLDHLPVNESLDIRVVEIEGDHLGRATGGSAGLDRARGPIADAQERHQTRRGPATGKSLTGAAKIREIGPGPGTILEQARLAHPQIHDAAFIDKVVRHRLDKTGMGLWVFVGIVRLGQAVRRRIYKIMPVGLTRDTIGIMKAGVEPLGRIGSGNLVGEHITQLVMKCLSILSGIEITVLLPPVPPAFGKASEHLARIALTPEYLLTVLVQLRPALIVILRDARLAKILLSQNINCYLRPVLRRLYIVQLKYYRTIRVPDLRRPFDKIYPTIRRLSVAGEVALYFQIVPPVLHKKVTGMMASMPH